MAVPPAVVDDARWRRWFEATEGAFGPCFQCGVCTATCPWGEVRGDRPLPVRTFLHRLQLGLSPDGEGDLLWLCTTCGLCETRCPRGVEIVPSLRLLREARYRARRYPDPLRSALWGILEEGNPWGGKEVDRDRWARDLELPVGRGAVLLHAGCAVSYDRRLQRLARSLVRLLRAAGVEVGILGTREACCGEPAHAVGDDAFLEWVAVRHERTFQEAGAERLLVLSPHCLYLFRKVYPRYGVHLPVEHALEALDRLLGEGRLPLRSDRDGVRVTYHDPCYLARYLGIQAAPRRLLEAAGFELVEMERTRAETLCCGGGGGRIWLDTPPEERTSTLRVREAAATGAQVLATACPFCIQNFEDSLRIVEGAELAVRDVVEILADRLRA